MATRHQPVFLKWQFKLRHIGFNQLLSAKLYNSYLKTKTRPIVSDGRVLSGRREPRYGRWLAGLGELPTKRSAAAAGRAASVALQAGAIADHGEVAAFGATLALVALNARLGDLLGR